MISLFLWTSLVIIVAILLSLFLGYRYGAYNFFDFPFTRYHLGS